MALIIQRDAHEAMLAAARKAAPLEACGLCGGKDGRVTRFYELANADASGEHYSMLPAEQFAAVKDMRARGIGMLALWHSHPATPARMSEEDLRLAYTPEAVYLITSLAASQTPDTRGFTVHEGRAEPVGITIVEE